MKSILSAFQRAMPLMMVLFILLAALHLAFMLHISWQKATLTFLHGLESGRAFWLPLAGTGFFLAVAGWLHECRANALARRGLHQRHGAVITLLNYLTHRHALETQLARQHRTAQLDTEELAVALRARVFGQDTVCEALAKQLRRRFALHTPDRPVGVFLFAGPAGSGKKHLARQIAHMTERPLFFPNLLAENRLTGNTGQGSITQQIALRLKEQPDAVVVLKTSTHALADTTEVLLAARENRAFIHPHTHEAVSITDALFILVTPASSGWPKELEDRLDGVHVFQPLQGPDLARAVARTLMSIIESYGLHVERGGIDPMVLLTMMQTQEDLATLTTISALSRAFETMLEDSLIRTQRQGKKHVRLVLHDQRLGIEASDAEDQRLVRGRL